MNKRRISIVL
jgi:Ca2+-binding EF-hand superfamily protein